MCHQAWMHNAHMSPVYPSAFSGIAAMSLLSGLHVALLFLALRSTG